MVKCYLRGSAARSKTTSFMRRDKRTGYVWNRIDIGSNRMWKKQNNFRKPNYWWCQPVFKFGVNRYNET